MKSGRPNFILATCILASGLAFVDGSVTNVALPAIGKSFAARGADPLHAAVWGTYLHAAVGRSLTAATGRLGLLASEIVDRLTIELEMLP